MMPVATAFNPSTPFLFSRHLQFFPSYNHQTCHCAPRPHAAATNMCNPPLPLGARVRVQSLPTTRELDYLANIRVRRSRGRAVNMTRTSAFSLMVWPLYVYTRDNMPVNPKPPPGSDEGFVVASVTQDFDIDSDSDSDSDNDTNNDTDADFHSDSASQVKSEFEDYTLQNEAGDQLIGPSFPSNNNSIEDSNNNNSNNSYNNNNSIDDNDNDNDEKTKMSLVFNLPPWAYTVAIRATKPNLGKRAVQRNRAKRRMRTAAAAVLPQFALRGMEYRFVLKPEILVIDYESLVQDVRTALKSVNCWEDFLTEDMVRREKYCRR